MDFFITKNLIFYIVAFFNNLSKLSKVFAEAGSIR